MYSQKPLSPLQLSLDPKNPRFIIPDSGNSQDQIRKYLLQNEDVLSLARSIGENKGLMPGDRIVICVEDEKNIVLEGNRRTCACQLFLDRNLIPEEFKDRYPSTSELLNQDIKSIQVDIIPTREEAKRFLAVRHIEQTRRWSPLAKMRFCYEDFLDGRTVVQISERTGISNSDVKKFIRRAKLLYRAIDSKWTDEEKLSLNVLAIDPEKLLRIFDLKETRYILKLSYDNAQDLLSNLLSTEDLDEIIHIWARKAFIENKLNTRTEFGFANSNENTAFSFIKNILDKYLPKNLAIDQDASDDKEQNDASASTTRDNESKGSPDSHTEAETNVETQKTKENGGGPPAPSFFTNLNWEHVDDKKAENRGIISICNELHKISSQVNFVDNYPICTAFLIRAAIEHSLIFHAKKNNYWNDICKEYFSTSRNHSTGSPNLKFILDQYFTKKTSYIQDPEIIRIMGSFNLHKQTDKLNLVVHHPESYLLSPSSLRSLPDEGLLAIINHLLA